MEGRGRVFEDTATMLFGMPDLRVVEVDREADGGVTVYVATADEQAITCPECTSRPSKYKEDVPTRTKDLTFGDRYMHVVWLKRRWHCPSVDCARQTFTEALPEIPVRARLTTRLRRTLARSIAESGRNVTEVARSHDVSWPTVHDAFKAEVDPILDKPLEPVRNLGLDEVRRGRARWKADQETGETVTLADRWHSGFTDLTGDQGLLGQVPGRAANDIVAWLRAQPTRWLAGIQTVSIDMCASFRAALRKVLPRAVLCVDPFHLVQLANKMVTAVRQRLVREKYGRRIRKDDPEYGIKRLLLRNLEDLGPERLARLWNTLADDPALTDLHLAWIAKEKLRDILALRTIRSGTKPTEKDVLDRWDDLATWCETNKHIPELSTFMTTLGKWKQEIINTVLTGASNAGSEGINRIQKLDARASSGYRNPDNQRRRARVATLRSRTQQRLRTVKTRSSRTVTTSQPNPG